MRVAAWRRSMLAAPPVPMILTMRGWTRAPFSAYHSLAIVDRHAATILDPEVMAMVSRVTGLVLLALAVAIGAAAAAEWSRAKISRLPDSAFAAVEIAPDGRRVRHLPHNDETGALDLAHLKAARARLAQVMWLDPASGPSARRHLEEHLREISP